MFKSDLKCKEKEHRLSSLPFFETEWTFKKVTIHTSADCLDQSII
jgi:hypothetical protein